MASRASALAPSSVLIGIVACTLAACGGDAGSPPTAPPPNEPPDADLSATPMQGPPPLSVAVTLDCSDPDGSISEHRLDLDDDGAFEVVRAAAVDTTVTYVRDVSVSGQCVDDEGAESATTIRQVDVELDPPAGTVSLLPRDWTIPTSRALPFRMERAAGAPDGRVVWSVNGVEGGGEAVGTVDAAGRYTAPDEPPPGPVRVGAWVEGSAAAFADAPVQVEADPGAPSLREAYMEWRPRVVSAASGDTAELRVVLTEGYASSVELDVGGVGDVRELQPFRSRTWRIRLPPDDVLLGYRQGDLHTFVGFLRAFDGDASTARLNLFANVRDGTVPPVTVRRLADDVQAGDHVVNVRHDALFLDGELPTEVTRRFYDLFPDDFDFLAVVEQVDSPRNRFFHTVRGTVEGIDKPLFDRSGRWGSAGRLRGFLRYPLSPFFDLASPTASHEIGHQWMVFVETEPALRSAAHWARGSAARGIMGISIPPTGQGGDFPFEVASLGGDEYELSCAGPSREFNDLELYLMGLLPADSVGPHVVFDDQGIELSCGTRGTATTVTVDDVIAAHGRRMPAYPDAPTDFSVGTIVLSRGRLLTEEEMAFFDHMAARGASRTELHFTEGFRAGTAKPFFLATGGRATLSTTVRP